jgi:predicted ATPase
MVLCLGYMTMTRWMLGYPDQALARMHEMLTAAQQVAYAFTLARALYYAARLHRSRREWSAALVHAEAALALVNEHGFGHYTEEVTFRRGCALAAQGQYAEGIAQMQQALTATRGMVGELSQLTFLAAAYGASGQAEAGLPLLDAALAQANRTGALYYEAEVHRLKGELLLNAECRVRRAELAEASFQQALAIARGQQAKAWELRAATSLARLWQQQGKRDAARELLAPVYGWFTEGFDTADQQDARALLEELK